MLEYVIDALLAGLEGDGFHVDFDARASDCNVVQRSLVLTDVHMCCVCGAEAPGLPVAERGHHLLAHLLTHPAYYRHLPHEYRVGGEEVQVTLGFLPPAPDPPLLRDAH